VRFLALLLSLTLAACAAPTSVPVAAARSITPAAVATTAPPAAVCTALTSGAKTIVNAASSMTQADGVMEQLLQTGDYASALQPLTSIVTTSTKALASAYAYGGLVKGAELKGFSSADQRPLEESTAALVQAMGYIAQSPTSPSEWSGAQTFVTRAVQVFTAAGQTRTLYLTKACPPAGAGA